MTKDMAQYLKYRQHVNPFEPKNTFELRDYQTKITSFLADTPKAILFAGMSSGKTMMLIRRAMELKGATIVVCPSAVKGSWKDDMKKFNIDFPFISLDGSAKKNAAILNDIPDDFTGIIVVSYAMARTLFLNERKNKKYDAGFNFERLKPVQVVLDECHRIGDDKSKQTQALTYMFRDVPNKVAMTGTLYHDSLEKLWSITRFLFPEYKGRGHAKNTLDGMGETFKEYITRYFHFFHRGYHTIPIKPKKEAYDRIAQILSPYLYTLKTEDVVELPAVTYTKQIIPLEPKTRKQYEALMNDFYTEYGEQIVITTNALTSLTHLQQLTCNGVLEDIEGSKVRFGVQPRKTFVSNFFEVNAGKPTVVFYKFKEDYKILVDLAEKVGIEYATLNGSLKDHDMFIDGSVKLVLVNITSGSSGVRLSKCGLDDVQQVLFYSFNWSNADYAQAVMRVRRSDNELQRVFVTTLVSEGVENDIFERIINKQDIESKMDKAVENAMGSD